MSIEQGLSWATDRIPPTHRAWVEVDLGAIRHNVQAIRRLLRPSIQLMSVVKADGYGHGAVAVARTALSAGASWLAVATVEEGIQLRKADIERRFSSSVLRFVKKRSRSSPSIGYSRPSAASTRPVASPRRVWG